MLTCHDNTHVTRRQVGCCGQLFDHVDLTRVDDGLREANSASRGSRQKAGQPSSCGSLEASAWPEFVGGMRDAVSVTTIHWEDLDPTTVENVIAALLVRTVPGAQPVEGAGGDEGADVVAPLADGQHVYEIKSFTGRLNPSRKRQILASLRTARDHRPEMRAWTLVLPTDLTPDEQRWFTSVLGAEVAVPVTWKGRIELDAAFAERPDLSRNFLPGSAEALALDMVVQKSQETAALAGGFPDVVDRVAKLRTLGGKVDPDWDIAVDSAPGMTTARLIPKDPGAFTRSVVGGSLQVSAQPDSPQATAISNFELFGTPLHLHGDDIAQVDLQLPGQLDTLLAAADSITSLHIETPPGPEQRMHLVALRAGTTVRRLPVTLTHGTQGMRGGRSLVLVDDAQVLRMQFWIQPEQAPRTPGQVEFEIVMRPDRHPADVIPAVEFVAGLAECDGLRLAAPGNSLAPIRLPRPTAPKTLAPVAALLAQLTALQRVQDATGDEFGIPALTAADQDMLYFADQLLTYGYVEWYWSGATAEVPLGRVGAMLGTAPLIPRANLAGRGDGAVTIAGHTINLPGVITLDVIYAAIVNPAELHRTINQPQPPPTALVKLGPQASTQVLFRLDCKETIDDADTLGR